MVYIDIKKVIRKQDLMNMKTLILYTTITGATEKYVNWLKNGIEKCAIQNIENQPEIDFENFERVIFALPTYSGQINKKEILENKWEQIKSKLVYLVVIGGVPQESSWSQKSYNSIKKEVRDGLKGYVKIIGLAQDVDKKMNKVEHFLAKLFLGIDPDKIDKRKEVFEEDLKAVWEMLNYKVNK